MKYEHSNGILLLLLFCIRAHDSRSKCTMPCKTNEEKKFVNIEKKIFVDGINKHALVVHIVKGVATL